MEGPKVPNPNNYWNAQLFSCMDDTGQCCTACWCPCITFGKNKEAYNNQNATTINQESCMIYFILMLVCSIAVPFYQAGLRGEIRSRYSIPGSFFGDCCLSCWCGCCTLIQEQKELKIRKG